MSCPTKAGDRGPSEAALWARLGGGGGRLKEPFTVRGRIRNVSRGGWSFGVGQQDQLSPYNSL